MKIKLPSSIDKIETNSPLAFSLNVIGMFGLIFNLFTIIFGSIRLDFFLPMMGVLGILLSSICFGLASIINYLRQQSGILLEIYKQGEEDK